MEAVLSSIVLFTAIWLTVLVITKIGEAYATKKNINITWRVAGMCLFWALFYYLNT